MKSINIAVFDNDKYFLAMLKGYCYANHIAMIEVDFNRDGIKELEKIKPDLIIIPLYLLSSANKCLEAELLRHTISRNHLKICGLNQSPTSIISTGLSGWIDVIINNPFDIGAIDEYFKKTFFLLNIGLTEKRSSGERRSEAIRRSTDLIDGYKETKNQGYQHKTGNPGLNNFQIDQRNKCVLLKGKKVDLTPKEFELIELLLSDVNRTFMTSEIINHLWPENNRATKSDLYQYMHLLRKKIEKDPNDPQWILTIKGFGYRLNIDGSEEMHQKMLEQRVEPVN